MRWDQCNLNQMIKKYADVKRHVCLALFITYRASIFTLAHFLNKLLFMDAFSQIFFFILINIKTLFRSVVKYLI